MFEGDSGAGDCGPDPSLSELWRDAVGAVPVLSLAAEPVVRRSPAELLEMLAGWERQAAWIAGRQTALIAQFAEQVRAEFEQARREQDARGLPVSFTDQTIENDIEAEIGTALRLAPSTAGARVATAEALATRLPATQKALAAGKITYWHAVTMVRQTAHLDELDARAVEREVLPHAFRETVGALRRRLRKACMVVAPTDTSARARKATEERTVTLTPGEDGMATLQAQGPAPALQSVFDALDVTAGRAPSEDPRPVGARRFDALVDACVKTLDNAKCPGPPRVAAKVYLMMDLPTLLGLRDNPAELLGYGPLPAPLARVLAADNGWQRLIHDEMTGAPKDLGRLRRLPNAELRDWIRIRDRVCLFPGCYRSSARCDIDHRIEAGRDGGTDKTNLAPLCPKHHRVKDAGWRYVLHPDRIVWTSPHRAEFTRYLPDPDVLISENLDFLGQNEARLQELPDTFMEYAPPHATGDHRPDPDPGPPRNLPPGHPNYDPEPPDWGPPEREAPNWEPPDGELPDWEPPCEAPDWAATEPRPVLVDVDVDI
jgi:hypothetical protein